MKLYCGQGLAVARSSGGHGMISSCVIEAAPWRCAVPRQSAPVSPPPMMTTCAACRRPGHALEVAELHPAIAPVLLRQVLHRLKWMPVQLAAGHRQVARTGSRRRPGRTASNWSPAARSDRDVVADPSVHSGTRVPSAVICEAPIDVALLHLEVGDARSAADRRCGRRARTPSTLVAGAVELLRGGEPGGAGADDRDLLAGWVRSEAAPVNDPAFLEGAIDDRLLDHA